jgi:phosphoglycerol transferase MdoB-like AlkP superfamily enzyme
MREKTIFFFRYFLYWICFSFSNRLTFLFYHFGLLRQIPLMLLPELFLSGIQMDLAMACYLTCTPFLATIMFERVSSRFLNAAVFIYSSITLVTLSLVSISDLEIFSIWGFRIDATALKYLHNPQEALASSLSSPITLLVTLYLLIVVGFFWAYNRFVHQYAAKSFKAGPFGFGKIAYSAVALGLMLIVARGGFCKIPLNPSLACFSDNDFANQAAINVHWNFFRSVLNRGYERNNPYIFCSDVKAAGFVKNAFRSSSANDNKRYLSNPRPNIVLVILESFSATTVAAVGGLKGITPGFNRLAREGLLFSEIYATGDRTGKGLVGILSGYPAQPKTQIISSTRKASMLPNLGKTLKGAGYKTSFFYGGAIEFDNMKNYLFHGGFDNIYGVDDYDGNIPRSSWGVHDQNVFDFALKKTQSCQQPFFQVILTLSSHEPFLVPGATRFPGTDKASKYKNALAYTDCTLEKFVEKLKLLPVYKDTLIVILADHGTSYIGNIPRYDPKKFHIPLLFIGGALNSGPGTIERIGSQQDLAATLLAMLGIDSFDFNFSRNLLNEDKASFAAFFFNDGFTLVKNNGYVAFGNQSQRLLHRDACISDMDLNFGRMLMQVSFQDYLNKGEPR